MPRPHDSDRDKRVLNPGLAEEMAYAQKPFVEQYQRHQDASPMFAADLLNKHGDEIAAEHDAIETVHYKSLELSKYEVEAARRALGVVERPIESTEENEVLAESMNTLNNIRGFARALDDKKPPSESYSTAVWRNTKLRDEFRRHARDYEVSVAIPVVFPSKGKVEMTLGLLQNVIREQHVVNTSRGNSEILIPSETVRLTAAATVAEVFALQRQLAVAVGEKTISPLAAASIFNSFDLSRLSATGFKDILSNITYDGSNLRELTVPLLQDVSPSDAAMVQELKEYRMNKSQDRADASEAKTEARKNQYKAYEARLKELFVSPDANLTERKPGQENNAIEEILQSLDWEEASRYVFENASESESFIHQLMNKVAYSHDSEFLSKASHLFTVENIWRALDRPKGYYGGRVGKVSLQLQPLLDIEEDSEYTMPDYTTGKYRIKKQHGQVMRVGVNIETVKDRRGALVVDVISYTEFVLSRDGFVQDSRRQMAIPVDERRLERERLLDKEIGRITQTIGMLSPLGGGLPGLGKN